MNDDRLFALFAAHAEGTIGEAEHRELQEALRTSADARKLWFLHQDLDAGLRAFADAPAAARPRRSWRPLHAAVAGLLFGCFATSSVWALALGSLEPRSRPVFREDFEDPLTLQPGFPDRVGEWRGDPAEVVGPTDDVRPADGRSMLRLSPAPPGHTLMTRASTLIDVSGRPPGPLEVAVRYRSPGGVKARHLLRAAVFAEGPAEIQEDWVRDAWREIGQRALSHGARGVTPPPDIPEWHTLTLTVDVPPGARTLAVVVGAGSLTKPEARTAHFIDDVRVVTR